MLPNFSFFKNYHPEMRSPLITSERQGKEVIRPKFNIHYLNERRSNTLYTPLPFELLKVYINILKSIHKAVDFWLVKRIHTAKHF